MKRLVVGIGISALLLYLVIRKVIWHELIVAFREIHYLYLIPVIILTLLSLFLRAWRWHYLLAPVERVGLAPLVSATAIGLAANNLLPARLGEVVRAYAIGRQTGLPVSASFATIIVERILDVFTLLGFLSFSLLLCPTVFGPPGQTATLIDPLGRSTTLFSWVVRSGFIALLMTLGIMVILAIIVVVPEKSEAFLIQVTRKFSQRLGGWFKGTVHSFIVGLGVYRDWRLLGASLLLSVAVWFAIVGAMYYAFQTCGLSLPIAAPVVVMAILAFGLMIPSAPGFVGTFQWFTVAGLSLFAVGESRALSFSLVFHATQFFTITSFGLVALYREGLSLGTLRYANRRE
ncbi:MAG: flippase-like domain-containing protein [Candidatus Latescibacteria bacterium]|nr:flippase-like domain-containing protein [Candidatus Latescibacterota bacterium]